MIFVAYCEFLTEFGGFWGVEDSAETKKDYLVDADKTLLTLNALCGYYSKESKEGHEKFVSRRVSEQQRWGVGRNDKVAVG